LACLHRQFFCDKSQSFCLVEQSETTQGAQGKNNVYFMYIMHIENATQRALIGKKIATKAKAFVLLSKAKQPRVLKGKIMYNSASNANEKRLACTPSKRLGQSNI
jgi:hypothetical protein